MLVSIVAVSLYVLILAVIIMAAYALYSINKDNKKQKKNTFPPKGFYSKTANPIVGKGFSLGYVSSEKIAEMGRENAHTEEDKEFYRRAYEAAKRREESDKQ